MSIADGSALEEEERRVTVGRGSMFGECSVRILHRHLVEARATPPVYTLTPHDAINLLTITREWNELRAIDRRGPPLSPEDVLRNVLESTARLVAPKKK